MIFWGSANCIKRRNEKGIENFIKHHPDRGGDEKFKELSAAYETLQIQN